MKAFRSLGDEMRIGRGWDEDKLLPRVTHGESRVAHGDGNTGYMHEPVMCIAAELWISPFSRYSILKLCMKAIPSKLENIYLR